MKKPFAITLDVGTSLENRTGSWRTLRPTYVHKLPPCNHQCPAGEDIQGWLFYAESGNYEKAWRHLTRRNPLPSCMDVFVITLVKALATAANSMPLSALTPSNASSGITLWKTVINSRGPKRRQASKS